MYHFINGEGNGGSPDYPNKRQKTSHDGKLDANAEQVFHGISSVASSELEKQQPMNYVIKVPNNPMAMDAATNLSSRFVIPIQGKVASGSVSFGG